MDIMIVLSSDLWVRSMSNSGRPSVVLIIWLIECMKEKMVKSSSVVSSFGYIASMKFLFIYNNNYFCLPSYFSSEKYV